MQPRLSRMSVPLLGVLCGSLLWVQLVYAQPPPSPPPCPVLTTPGSDSGPEFLMVVLLLEPITETAYEYETGAVARLRNRDGSPAELVVDTYFLLKYASDVYSCALQLLRPYVDSHEDSIRLQASELHKAIESGAAGQARLRAPLEEIVNGSSKNWGTLPNRVVEAFKEFHSVRGHLRDMIKADLRRAFKLLHAAGATARFRESVVVARIKAQLSNPFVGAAQLDSPPSEPFLGAEVASAMLGLLSNVARSAAKSSTCAAVAQRRFMDDYFGEALFRDTYAPAIGKLAEKYGLGRLSDIAIVRTIDGPAFLNAKVVELECADSPRHLMVLGKRLLFFTWRTTVLLGSNLTAGAWPPQDVLDEYAETIKAYFGFRDLSERGTLGLQLAGRLSPLPGAARQQLVAMYNWMVRAELAELFVVAHEMAHVDGASNAAPYRQSASLSPNAAAGSHRTAWERELQADADAIVSLWFHSKEEETLRRTGRALASVCLAATTVVAAQSLLTDDIKATNSAIAEIESRYRTTHPPTWLRQSNVIEVCERLGSQLDLGDKNIADLRRELLDNTSAVMTLNRAVKERRPDVFAYVRALW